MATGSDPPRSRRRSRAAPLPRKPRPRARASVSVVDRAPFAGPVTIDVSGERHAIAHDLAGRIQIESDETE